MKLQHLPVIRYTALLSWDMFKAKSSFDKAISQTVTSLFNDRTSLFASPLNSHTSARLHDACQAHNNRNLLLCLLSRCAAHNNRNLISLASAALFTTSWEVSRCIS